MINASLNGIQQGTPIFVTILLVTMIPALALSSLIGNLKSDFSFVATLLLVTIDCLLGILILLGQMGMIYQKSKTLLRKMLWNHYSFRIPLRDGKWENRFYKSCSPLKTMINSVNFVDELTPLKLLEFAMVSTANLLMLSAKNN